MFVKDSSHTVLLMLSQVVSALSSKGSCLRGAVD